MDIIENEIDLSFIPEYKYSMIQHYLEELTNFAISKYNCIVSYCFITRDEYEYEEPNYFGITIKKMGALKPIILDISIFEVYHKEFDSSDKEFDANVNLHKSVGYCTSRYFTTMNAIKNYMKITLSGRDYQEWITKNWDGTKNWIGGK